MRKDGKEGDWVSAKDADDTARAKWADEEIVPQGTTRSRRLSTSSRTSSEKMTKSRHRIGP